MAARAPAPGMQKYMTNSFSVNAINKTPMTEGTSKTYKTIPKKKVSNTDSRKNTRETNSATGSAKNPNKVMIIITAVSTVVAIASLAILFAVVFTAKDTEDTNAKTPPTPSTAVTLQRQDSCQGDRRLLYELGDLCHDARSSNGPALECNLVGNNALLQGAASIGNAYEYGYDWEVVTVFKPCDPESDEPKVSLSILRSGELTNIQADEQSLTGVNKSYLFSFENRHYGVAGDTTKTLHANVNASFFSTSRNGNTEMRLLVVLQQTCWPGATSEQCDTSPIIIKNQVYTTKTLVNDLFLRGSPQGFGA